MFHLLYDAVYIVFWENAEIEEFNPFSNEAIRIFKNLTSRQGTDIFFNVLFLKNKFHFFNDQILRSILLFAKRLLTNTLNI